MKENKTTLLPNTDEPIENKTTAQKIKELPELGSMNHRTMIAKAKYTDFMNPYHMSCGNKTSVKNHTDGSHRCGMDSRANMPTKTQGSHNPCCMVAGAGKRNGNCTKMMACQDKGLKSWDLDVTKVRIQVDRTKWKKRYPCRSRLMQRLRRHACQAVKGCKPERQDIQKEEKKLLERLRKTQESLQSLRREEGKSASSWEDKSCESYQRMKGEKGPKAMMEESQADQIRVEEKSQEHAEGPRDQVQNWRKASEEEELCDYEEDAEFMKWTPVQRPNTETLGVWKRAQKMLAEACEEMARHRQMKEFYVPGDQKMDDRTGGEVEAGGDNRCFLCGSEQHETLRCPAPRGHRITVLTDETVEKRGRSEQAELQMKLVILQKINPRIARKPGPPRKKRPRKTAPKGSYVPFSHVPDPKEETWLSGKDGRQKQVIFRDIIPLVSGKSEELEEREALEASLC